MEIDLFDICHVPIYDFFGNGAQIKLSGKNINKIGVGRLKVRIP
jgi:hypothetical protein